MHAEAYAWVAAVRSRMSVCELGSRDVNGTVRGLFLGWHYVGVDVRPGPGVDVVADAADWDGGGQRFDAVVCCEVFEHCPDRWRAVVANAFRLLTPGGWFACTAAGPGRAPHSCDGHPMADPYPEPYANVDPADLAAAVVDAAGPDVRGFGVRPHP